MKPIFAFLLGAVVYAAAPGGLHAQAAGSTPASTGVYTTQQAARGSALYQAKCASCHSADLTGGGVAPSLAGADFASGWEGQPVAGLFDTIHTSMPADQPGTLTSPETADIVAFLLSSNKFPAGQTELPADSDRLNHILIDKAPAAPPKN